jgi:hypothetical protein
MRKNSYDQGHSWKPFIQQVDFETEGWEKQIEDIISNRRHYSNLCQMYFDKCWTPKAIIDYFVSQSD